MTSTRGRWGWGAAAVAVASFARGAAEARDPARPALVALEAAKTARKTPLRHPVDPRPQQGPAGASPEMPPRSEVLDAFRRVAPAVWDCAHARTGTLFAVVTFRATGAVTAVEIPNSDRGRRELECVRRAIREARVVRFSRPLFTLRYPFVIGVTRPEAPPPPRPPGVPVSSPSPARVACANRCAGNIDCLLRCSLGP